MSMIASALWRDDGSVVLRFPYHEGLLSQLKLAIPSHHRSWNPEIKAWIVWGEYAPLAVDLVRSVYANLRESRPGATEPGPKPGNSDRRTLYVTDDAPAVVVHAAYKALARLYHPDAGGDTHRMQLINAAYGRLKPTLKEAA